MNFLKKHYEKVALLALFIIFALLLVHLYTIIQATGEVKDSDLQIPTRDPDYQLADLKKLEFNLPELFKYNTVWNASTARKSENSKHFSDVMTVFKITRCGYCNHLIPRTYMENAEKCPYFNCSSKENLKKPREEKKGENGTVQLDSDEDGIPNLVELVYNLNPYDASDAELDLDDDGFINYYEYQQMKDADEFKKIFSEEQKNFSSEEQKNLILKDPKKHPGLYLGLKIDRLERQPLNMDLLGITVDKKNKNRAAWPIQIKIKEQYIGTGKKRRLHKERTNVTYIGEKIKLETGEYTIEDIKDEPIPVAKQTKDSGDTNYYIVLKKIQNKNKDKNKSIIFDVKKGIEAFDPEYRAYLSDIWNYKKYDGRVGNTIRMGVANIGFTRYTIREINKRDNSVTLETPDKKNVVIKTVPLMPQDVINAMNKNKDKEKSKDNDDGNSNNPSGIQR